jgi:hypothetical protein
MVVKETTKLNVVITNQKKNQITDLPMGTLKHGIGNPL